MTTKVSPLLRATGVEDPGRVDGAGTARPNPEVPERARRRTFTAQYKLEIVAEYDAAPEARRVRCCGGRACIPATSSQWRKSRDAGALAGLGLPRGRKRRDPQAERIARLEAEEQATGAGAGQGPLRGGRAGKTARALGDALRERGHRDRGRRNDRRSGR